jgi:hypothetical protein
VEFHPHAHTYPRGPQLYLLHGTSKDAKLPTHQTCCAAAPTSVPQLQVEAPSVHTLCAHMFLPHTSPRRYLQCTTVSHIYMSHNTNTSSDVRRTHPYCAPCHIHTTCSHKWSSHATASSQLQLEVVAGIELLSVAQAPVTPVMTQVTPFIATDTAFCKLAFSLLWT